MKNCSGPICGIPHSLQHVFVQRLQSRPQFQAVLAGVTVAKTEHFVLHRNALTTAGEGLKVPLFSVEDVWLGAMVPKRWARRAVTRNAIKRQVYTVGAELAQHFPHAAWVVRLRREFSRKQFPSAVSVPLKEAVRAEIVALMQGALKGSAACP